MADTQSIHIDDVSEGGELVRGPGRVRDPQKVQAFIEAYATTGVLSVAAQFARITTETASSWLRDARIVGKLHIERQRKMMTEGAAIGYRVLLEIATSDGQDGRATAPVAERRQAARELLRLGGHSETLAAQILSGQQAAALHELTEEQLAEHVRQAQETLAALRSEAPGVAPDSADKSSLL